MDRGSETQTQVVKNVKSAGLNIELEFNSNFELVTFQFKHVRRIKDKHVYIQFSIKNLVSNIVV